MRSTLAIDVNHSLVCIILPALGRRSCLLTSFHQVKSICCLYGWNPPKAYGGFWAFKTEDNLRSDLHQILLQLKIIESQRADASFLDEFLSKGLFFIHAVKCWTLSKYPGFG